MTLDNPLAPGVTLYVYGIHDKSMLDDGSNIPPVTAVVTDGDWVYLICTEPCLERISECGLDVAYSASLPYEQWLDGDMSSPISVVGLTLVPPWCESAVPQRADVLFIEPGLAFGTGAHPTTQRCLGFMERLLRGPLSGSHMTVLDLGCGTGLLGLAALRLGAAKVVGCDVSHHAIELARRNAHRNSLAAQSSFIEARASEVHEVADLLLANLPPAALDELIEHEALEMCSWLIASGMLARDLDKLLAALPPHLVLVESHRDGIWHSALFNATRPLPEGSYR